MTTRDIAKFTISNLDREVNAENLARFLGLTSSAYRESCGGDCTVRVQLNASTGHCLGFAVVSVPESSAKELLAHNGRFKADRKFCGGQPIVIYPVEDEGSTSNHKMDSSSRNVKSQSSDKSPGCKTGSSSVHVKSEPAVDTSYQEMDSTPRKMKSEPPVKFSSHKTGASTPRVKNEPVTNTGYHKMNSTPRHIKSESPKKYSPHKTGACSAHVKHASYEIESTPTQIKSESPIKTEACSAHVKNNPAANTSRLKTLSSSKHSEPMDLGTRIFKRDTRDMFDQSQNKYGAAVSTGTIRSASAQGDSTGFSTWVNNEPMSPRRPYRLIDIGANLTHRKYATDLPQVIQRSKAAGVQKVIVTGLNVRGSEEALKLCREYPSYLWCTVGVHPHDAKSWRSSTFDRLEYLSRQPGCVAIGECGLDFNRNYSPRDVQLEVFEKQVQLACKVRKPLLLHDRESHECFMKILNKYQAELPPVVCHCFTGRRTEALRYIAMGFYIGLTGYLWKDNSNDGVRSLLYDDEIPLDKILLETDAPFMYPFLGRGRFPQSTMDCVSPGSLQLLGCCSYQRNEPCAMPVINELIAGCMKRSPSELADITTENALRFFNLKGL